MRDNALEGNLVGLTDADKIKSDKLLSVFIMLEIYLPAVKYFIIHSFSGLVKYNTAANYFLGVLFLTKKGLKTLMIPAVVVFLLSVFTWLLYPNNRTNLFKATIDIGIISYCLFVACLCLDEYGYLHKVMSRYAIFVIAFAVICAVLSTRNGLRASDFTSYDMSISYFCLIPTLICFCNIKRNRWVINVIGFLAGSLIILALGSRGTLIAIVFFVLLYRGVHRLFL